VEISVSYSRLDLHSDPYMHVSPYWTIVVDFPTSAGDFIYDVGFLLVRLFLLSRSEDVVCRFREEDLADRSDVV